MELELCNSAPQLRKRVIRFLSSTAFGRQEVATVIDKLNAVGEVAIFGGMLRDLCLVGNRGFYSDIDLVVSGCTRSQVEAELLPYKKRLNKFGGFRIYLGHWKADVWRLEETWAFTKNILKCDGLESLISSAFFDWDAIAYDTTRNSLVMKTDYFERIDRGVLDINLNASPNAVGNAIKALRYSERYDAAMTSRLANFVFSTVSGRESSWLKGYESQASDVPVLTRSSIEQVLGELENHQRNLPLFEFKRKNLQYQLIMGSGRSARQVAADAKP